MSWDGAGGYREGCSSFGGYHPFQATFRYLWFQCGWHGSFDVNFLYLAQGGLGLPDRSYYLEQGNAKFAAIRLRYLAYIASMLRLAGFDNADARSKGIFALETKMAEVHWSKAEFRQPDRQGCNLKLEDLSKTYPGFDWAELAAAVRVQKQKSLYVSAPSAIAGISKLLASEPLDVWKDHLAFHTLKMAAPFLPKAFVEENFVFLGTVLTGQLEIQPRWMRGVHRTTEALGDAIGKVYVANYFPPEAKQQADQMIKNIIAAMDQRLADLTWMDPSTKTRARSKLASLTFKIGYPSTWRDYSGLEVRRGDALGNALRVAEFGFQQKIDKLDSLIDPELWHMTPMMVDAYAWISPNGNEMVFPAGILQPPYYDPNADPAVNYGGIGAVIGHEISHHFDNKGRKIDEAGYPLNWWTVDDSMRFKALSERVVKQYAAFEPLPGIHVDGELTLGENIADLAGLNIAYDAYHRSLKGKAAEVLEGFTGDQRFFLSFAQIWCWKSCEQALLRQVATDPHTPQQLRPNVVRNLDAWYEAFGVKAGQSQFLAPEDRIKFW